MGDAYLTTGQYSRVGNGVESPTYIQLENASVSTRPGYYSTGIYSPPASYRGGQDFLGPGTTDHPIYTVKPPTNTRYFSLIQFILFLIERYAENLLLCLKSCH